MTLRKRIIVTVLGVLLMVGVALWARAQPYTPYNRPHTQPLTPVNPVTPTVISDGDLGFRIVGMRGQTPVGQLMVRINGQWVEAAFGSAPQLSMR